MAQFTSTSSAFNMDAFRVGRFQSGSLSATSNGVNSLQFSASGPAGTLNISLIVSGLGANQATQELFGNITQAVWNENGPAGRFDFVITGLNFSLNQTVDWIEVDDTASVLNAFFGGNDRFDGSPFADLLRGLGGNDFIDGRGGADTIYGGLGNDTISSQSNLGTNRYLRGDEGDDTISGVGEFDDINGNMGNDTAQGNGGSDWVVGGKDDDMLWGDSREANTNGTGNDLVYGNLGNDTLDGDGGNDTVRGGQGADVLTGDAGDDYVSGDLGDDTMTGGFGLDTFHSFVGSGIDRVTDFRRDQGDFVRLDPGTQYAVIDAGADTYVDLIGGGRVILVGIQASSLTGNWILVG